MTIHIGSGTYGMPGPSVRTITHKGTFYVVSSPQLIHVARIDAHMVGPRYSVTVLTAEVTTRRFDNIGAAVRHAGTIVGALYRVDMRSKFTGPQRYAMGRNLCPARIPCPDGGECLRAPGEVTHYHLCLRAPAAGPVSVWCVDHAPTTELPGDAFRALGDTGAP